MFIVYGSEKGVEYYRVAHRISHLGNTWRSMLLLLIQLVDGPSM